MGNIQPQILAKPKQSCVEPKIQSCPCLLQTKRLQYVNSFANDTAQRTVPYLQTAL